MTDISARLRDGALTKRGADEMIMEAADHIDALEASNRALVEALEWQSEVIENAITGNEIGGHGLFLDDEYHMGPVVDWVHEILTGFSKINRAAIAAAEGLK